MGQLTIFGRKREVKWVPVSRRLHRRIEKFKNQAEQTAEGLAGAISKVESARRLSAKYSAPRGARDAAMSYLSPLSRNFSSGEEMYDNLEKLKWRLGLLQESRDEAGELSSVLRGLYEPMRQTRPSALSPKVWGAIMLVGTALVGAGRLFNAPKLDLSIVSKAIATGAGRTLVSVALIVSAAVAAFTSKRIMLWPEVSHANNRLDALEPGLQRLQGNIEICTEGVDELLAHFGPKNLGNQTHN